MFLSLCVYIYHPDLNVMPVTELLFNSLIPDRMGGYLRLCLKFYPILCQLHSNYSSSCHVQKEQRESAFTEWLRVKKEQKKREEKMKNAKEEEVTEGKKVHTRRQCERAFRR